MTRSLALLFMATAPLALACGEASSGSAGRGDAQPTATTEPDALIVCPTGETLEGADVSSYDGAVDWAALKASGRSFAFARVADGSTFLDPTFPDNWQAMKINGFVRGPYQYFRAAESAFAQASVLLATIEAAGALEPGDLPPVLDLETTDGETDAVVIAGAQEWLAAVRAATGREPIVYTAPGFWNDEDGYASLAWLGTLWIADWDVSCPALATGYTGWQFWQYDDKGTAPGLGADDADLDRFNGSLADLQALAAMSTVQAGAIAGVGEAWGEK